jgi:hypothetical protein
MQRHHRRFAALTDMGDLGTSRTDQQEGHRVFALAHEHLTGYGGERLQQRRQWCQVLRGTPGEELQRGQFPGTRIGHSRHVTRLRPGPRRSHNADGTLLYSA